MERKIGEIFEYNGEWYQCVECDSCGKCSLRTTECGSGTKSDLADEVFGECSKIRRSDYKHIIFKKLEKVGEPTMLDGKLVQKILTTDRYSCNGCCFESPECDKVDNDLCREYEIYVEIKQTKEDMEGKEQCGDNRFEVIEKAKKHLLSSTNIESSKEEMKVLDDFLFRCWQMGWLKRYEGKTKELNLKPFDIQKAKDGKPVCTRDGRKARIICFDRKFYHDGYNYPIVAMVNDNDNELVHAYTQDGLLVGNAECELDLMMLPEKKEGWAKIRKDINLYDTKEEADRKMIGNDEYVTAKVCWEE